MPPSPCQAVGVGAPPPPTAEQLEEDEDFGGQPSPRRRPAGATDGAAAAPAPSPPSVKGGQSPGGDEAQRGGAAVPLPHVNADCAVQQQHAGVDAMAAAMANFRASDTNDGAAPVRRADEGDPGITRASAAAATVPIGASRVGDVATSVGVETESEQGHEAGVLPRQEEPRRETEPQLSQGGEVREVVDAQLSFRRLSAGAADGAAAAPAPPPPPARGLPSLDGDEAQRGAAAILPAHVGTDATVQQQHAGGDAAATVMANCRDGGTHGGAAPDGGANEGDPGTARASAAAVTVSVVALRVGDMASDVACKAQAETEAVRRKAESEESHEARVPQRLGRQHEELRWETDQRQSQGDAVREEVDAQLSLRRLSAGAAAGAAAAPAPPSMSVKGLPSLDGVEGHRDGTAVPPRASAAPPPLPGLEGQQSERRWTVCGVDSGGGSERRRECSPQSAPCDRRDDGFAHSAGAPLDDSDAAAAAPDTTPLRAEPTVKGGGAVTPESDDVTAAPSIPGLARGKRDCVGVPTPSGDTPACKRLTHSATTPSPALSAPLPSYTLQDVPGMRVPELKAELTRRNLSADGLKSALVARLAQAMAAPDSR